MEFKDLSRRASAALLVAALAVVTFAQSDRGTITGTISDSAGAVIAGAAISVKNTLTGAIFETITTDTGNYTVGQLPVAPYEVSVTSAGFSKYVQQGIRVQVAQISRVDVVLQIGSTSETVSVTADAPLLRTDSSDVSTNISMRRVNELPLYGAQAGDSGIRSPYAAIRLVPGSTLLPAGANNNVRVNGMPNNTYQVRIEGQESTNAYSPQYPTGTQPGVDALEEVSFQTSNFAAEYGQIGGGLINFTSKSGTNQLHGSVFEFFTNEFLNAGRPFTNNGQGSLIRPRTRGNNYGGSIGGPIVIPKLYDGRNKSFFFFNIERTPSSSRGSANPRTVPTEAFRRGDFSSILTGRVLGTDPLGRPILENTIYDPATRRLAPNGQVVTDPFPGNIIPINRFDPVAAKIQALIPSPINSNLINNWIPQPATESKNALTTVKGDHNFNDKQKMSFYLSWRTASGGSTLPGYGADGLPVPLTASREGSLNSPTVRINYDHVLSPATLLHLGVGLIRHQQPDVAVEDVLLFDAPGQLGLRGGIVENFVGAPATGFPRINGIGNSTFGGFDGNLGPTNANYYYMIKPTWVVSVSHVRSNHSFKFGAEWRKEAFTDRNVRGTQGIYDFSTNQTALPSIDGQNLGGGTVGHGYASFLLGGANAASVSTKQDPQFRKTAWGVYAQDTWKASRTLTVDYGVRYDLQSALSELHDRIAAFEPSIANPSAGGLLGGTAYAGDGPGRIGGQFTKSYPFAIGPRLGIAWQIAPQTVLRAGGGITYGQTGTYNWISNTPLVGVGWSNLLFNTQSFGEPAVTLRNGLQYDPSTLNAVTLDPGVYPTPGQIQAPTYWLDPNGGRPSRTVQWSVSLQRQIGSNLAVEAAYVANRSVWNQAANMNDLNALTPERIRAAGLDLNNAADRTLLTQRLDSEVARQRGFGAGPYASFPRSQTVAQSLRPYPQFPNIPVRWSPLGNSWYDSLQAKLTQRYSHGLEATVAFTWQKELSIGESTVNDVFNRDVQKTINPSSLPFILASAINYRTPRFGANKWLNAITSDWSVSAVLRYQSGLPILVPLAQNSLNSLLFRNTFANRVPGEPLFLQDLNCHCFDPNKTFVLNPKAWANPEPGQFGTSAAYYNDYRYQRRPDEQVSVGRAFRVREGMSFTVRAMFYNVFNRTYPADPDSTNAGATQTVRDGTVVSGFGRINTGSSYFVGQRTGRLEARFTF